MRENPLKAISSVGELIDEIELHLKDKAAFHETYRLLKKSYQKGQFGYFRYEQLRKKLLKDKTIKEWDEYYDAYIYGLLKRIEHANSKIFYAVWNDKTEMKISIPIRVAKKHPERLDLPKAIIPQMEPIIEPDALVIKKATRVEKPITEAPVAKVTVKDELKPSAVKDAEIIGDVQKSYEESLAVEPEAAEQNIQEIAANAPLATEDAEKVSDKPEAPPTGAVNAEVEGEAIPLEEIEAEHVTDIPKEEIFEPERKRKEGKRTLARLLFGEEPKPEEVLPWLAKKKRVDIGTWFRRLFSGNKTMLDELREEKDDTKLEFKDMFNSKFFKNLLNRKGSGEYIGKETHISPSIIALKRYKSSSAEPIGEGESLDTSLLLQEAQRIKSIIKKRTKFTVYEHSTIGTLANIMVKRISLSMIETFPDFFKQIYDNLRLADIKILSNTYVNIMLLGSVVTGFIMFFISLMIFFLQNNPLILVLIRGMVVGGLFSGIAFLAFYLYPTVKIKQRRRSINTNMPFAINHMSAVASSGVPPEAMFRLIAESKEYEEISVEIEKISEYIDVFGYDILTAVKSVGATTPSPQLKDFFSGFVSAIETGGDLKHYLEQKSEEAMLSYKLERQKYLESISTYSDIYTGLLIAAPLFFVVALSLVSLLGGTVGGVEVDTLIAIGTYVVIPLLNVAFIIFLEMTQPEV